ncbi:MAG: hypothetical protein EON61_08275 [Alphaproteobacteria bacterium]|nr:MAG: hypothetical protein EON61_08275 [Alphaproteobacteria bacterium]
MRGSTGALVGLAVVFATLTPFTLPASAHPISSELSEKFARGAYMEAARDAETAATPDELAFAARSLLAYCMTGTGQPDAAIIDRAERNAEAALKREPGLDEARLQLAIALALKSRPMDAMAAWNSGYGEKGRKLADQVLKSDPSNVYALGFLAVWNIEVQKRGGGMGSWMMGASLDKARNYYAAAANLAPDDIGLHWQYARALVALDAKKYGNEAMNALNRAAAADAGDYLERVMQQRAADLAAALKSDKPAAQKLAEILL